MTPQPPPLVDLSAFVHTSAATKHEIDTAATALLNSASDFGYAHVGGHSVPESVTSRLFEECRQFFQDCATGGEDQLDPRVALSSTSYRGFQKLGENVTLSRRDTHRAIDALRTLPDGYNLPDSASPALKQLAFGKNIFPTAELEKSVEEYMQAVLHTGGAVMRAVCHALRMPPAVLADCFSDPFWILRLISYPSDSANDMDAACSEPKLGCGQHRDYGWLTFVITDESPGSIGALEISTDGSDNKFEPAALPPPGSFLLNFGDCLEALTNGLFPATLHRVACPRRDRLAIAAFVGKFFSLSTQYSPANA